MDSRILDELEAAFGQELALVGDDLGALETAVQGKTTAVGPRTPAAIAGQGAPRLSRQFNARSLFH
jgi:hypothetical protein